ncbi:N-acetylmuramoyl-L-alanine amidase [Anaerostipes faecalis]|uniref:N-acetylmuramoyl-L-alanine amidase n=1 Tax=Anaerostipes faecalis TaxID=2738446 RepID=UPI003EFD7281
MAKYNVHAGHCPQGKGASGAVGFLKESVEDRIVKNEMIRLLKAEGHTAYDCTCDVATTQSGCLARIVAKCNSHSVDKDASVHLNSGRKDSKGDGYTGGVEVLIYSLDSESYDTAVRICEEVSKELGIRNRGVKVDKSLYVLRKTKAPAFLVECCFVDDKDDCEKWDAKRCAKAIVKGMLNKDIKGCSSTSGSTGSSSNTGLKPSGTTSTSKTTVTVDGYWGSNTTKALQKIFRTTVDGKVSNQYKCYESQNPGLDDGWEWEDDPSGYSPLIKAVQKMVGVTQDGHIGPKTIKAIQKYFGCTQDGVFSAKSPCIKKLQQWINKQ